MAGPESFVDLERYPITDLDGQNGRALIERIRAELPDVQIVLGLSNISFGLNPPARQVLNSVFLDEAVKRGMTAAIVPLERPRWLL